MFSHPCQIHFRSHTTSQLRNNSDEIEKIKNRLINTFFLECVSFLKMISKDCQSFLNDFSFRFQKILTQKPQELFQVSCDFYSIFLKQITKIYLVNFSSSTTKFEMQNCKITDKENFS